MHYPLLDNPMTSPPSYYSLQPNIDYQSPENNSRLWSVADPRISTTRDHPSTAPTTRRVDSLKLRTTPSSPSWVSRDVNITSDSHNEASLISENDDENKLTPTKCREAGWWTALATDTWTLEMFASFLSFADFASLLGVLRAYDHKPIPALVRGVTLNAVISFLATISRTSIMLCIGTALSQGKWLWFKKKHSLMDLQDIENASRGPLGSALLLSKSRGGPVLYIAALLTVVSLGFDPFVQQLLTVQTHFVAVEMPGVFIKAARSFDTSFVPMSYPETEAEIVAAMLADVQQYPFSAVTWGQTRHVRRSGETTQFASSPLGLLCPSGNCIWDPYYALDICTQCRDTTPEMAVTTSSNNSENTWNYVIEQAQQHPEIEVNVELIWDLVPKNGNSWQVSSNLSATHSGDVYTPCSSSITRKVIWPLNFASFKFSSDQDADTVDMGTVNRTAGNFAGLDEPIAAVGFAEFSLDSNTGLPTLNNSLECALTYCVKEFNRSVIQGKVVTNILSKNYGVVAENDDGYIGWTTAVNGTNYAVIGPVDYYGAGIDTLLNYLLGSVTYDYTENMGPENMIPTTPESPETYQALHPDAWRGIDFADNFTTVLENTNAIISDILQQNGNISIPGSAAVTESFVVVRWPWITLPAVTVLLGLFVFSLIVWESRRLNVPKCSSSLLPLLYRHVDVDSGDAFTNTNRKFTAYTMGREYATTNTSLATSNLISRFEVEAEATTLRFDEVFSGNRVWQLRSLEVIYKDKSARRYCPRWW